MLPKTIKNFIVQERYTSADEIVHLNIKINRLYSNRLPSLLMESGIESEIALELEV